MSLAVGIGTALVALIIGTVSGAVAGYRGGLIDTLLMRLVDIFYTLPSLLLAILTTVFIGRGFVGVLVALGITAWAPHARLVRAQVLQARELAYVEAARAIGVNTVWIILRHILPNLWGPILVSLALQIPTNIMAESFLSFIGLGLQPPFSSWGTLAHEGFRAMSSFPHLMIFPGLILFITLYAFNVLADSLIDFRTKHEI